WTDANYAALTELLATLPVHWRHYMKKRIFAALAEIPAHQRRGDGSEVRRAFEAAVGEFPQLRPAQAAEGTADGHLFRQPGRHRHPRGARHRRRPRPRLP